MTNRFNNSCQLSCSVFASFRVCQRSWRAWRRRQACRRKL